MVVVNECVTVGETKKVCETLGDGTTGHNTTAVSKEHVLYAKVVAKVGVDTTTLGVGSFIESLESAKGSSIKTVFTALIEKLVKATSKHRDRKHKRIVDSAATEGF